jgi:hypothetical protein
MPPSPRIVNGAGNTGRGAAREGEILANRFADDLGAGIKKPRYHRRVEFGHETLEHRRAIGQRHAGQRVGIFHRHFLARKLAAARALNARLGDPGPVFVFLALRPVIGAAWVFHRGDIVRQRRKQPIAIAERPDEVDERISVVLGHFHAEAVTQFADLIRRRHLKGHEILPCLSCWVGWAARLRQRPGDVGVSKWASHNVATTKICVTANSGDAGAAYRSTRRTESRAFRTR